MLVNNYFNPKETFCEFTIEYLKEKAGIIKWVDGVKYEYDDLSILSYTHKFRHAHNDTLTFNIQKLKVYHTNSIYTYIDWQDRYMSGYGVISHSGTFDFGKHNSKPIIDVLLNYPDYIVWCISTVEYFSISETLVVMLLSSVNTVNNELFDAIELNLLKLKLVEIAKEAFEEERERDESDELDDSVNDPNNSAYDW